MSWVTVTWSMLIGACAAIALPYLVVGIWQRRAAHLFFSLAAVAVVGIAIGELFMMRASTPEMFGRTLQWTYLFYFVLVAALIGFVWFYFGAGRFWLGLAILILRFIGLVINFLSPPNLNFREITGLHHVRFFGETVSIPVGVRSPWTYLGELSSLLLVAFVVDAAISVWRREKAENRPRAAIVCGSIAFFVLVTAGVSALINRQIIDLPYWVSFPFAAILAAMAFELGVDLVGAAKIAERLRLSEASLHETEHRFQLAADSAPVMIWMSGVDKLCTFFNKSWLEFTGRTTQQEMGMGWAEGVHPDDLQGCLTTYTEAFDARKPFVMQYRLRRHDGQYCWIKDDGVPRYDAEGKFAGYIGSCVDISELISNEQALRESEERRRMALDAAQVGLWDWNFAKDELWGTKARRVQLGLPLSGKIKLEEVLSRVHADDRNRVRKVLMDAARTGKDYRCEYRIKFADGSERWTELRGRYVKVADGEAVLRTVTIDVTERKEAQELFRLAAEGAHLGIWSWDEVKNQLVWDDATRRMFDVPANAEITLDTFYNSLHPDDRERVTRSWRQALELQQPYQIEFRAKTRDGAFRWVHARGRGYYDKDGKPLRMIGLVFDITEQKRAQDLFRLATEASPSGIVLVDHQGRIVLVNAHIEELFGYTRDELVGKPVELLVPERFRSQHPKYRADFVAAPETRAMGAGRDLFARRKDRSEFPVEIGLNPIHTPEGLLVLANVVDITERKQAEEKFRLAVEASPSGILLVNREGNISLVNTQAERMFGYDRKDLIGKPVEMLLPQRFVSAHPAYRANFFAAPQTRPMGAGRELFARRKDGSEFPVEIGLNPLQTAQGLVILANVVDISARLEAEEEARRRREQVELLGRASLLGEIGASLAHELTQPLAAIMNNASAAMEYIKQGRLSAKQLQEILTDVMGDGSRALKIVRDVRNAIKKGTAIRGLINLNDVAKSVAHMLHPDAAANFCKVEMSLAPDLPAIEGDPTQIQQVLINLVSNAFDAMGETPASRRIVQITTNSNGDGTISVAVRDHGCGIAETARERLFEHFFTTKKEGLGMGLAIVHSIVKAHGGTIAAENAPGGGARFHFRLPIKKEMPQ